MDSAKKLQLIAEFKKTDITKKPYMFFGLLTDTTLQDSVRLPLAFEYYRTLSEAQKEDMYPGPIRNFFAFLLTRQFLDFDSKVQQYTLEKIAGEDPTVLSKLQLNESREIGAFMRNMIERCSITRRQELLSFLKKRVKQLEMEIMPDANPA